MGQNWCVSARPSDVAVLVHNDSCPTQVYRTPRAGNKDLESNGPNPSLHQEGDQSAYLGDKSVVTGHYAGQAGYEQGYYEYMMAPEFDNEFSQYKFPCDGGDGMQWQIPADNIARFNELITGQRHGIGKVAVWVPVWRFQLSG